MRHLFLIELEHQYPDVLNSLATDALPCYEADDGSLEHALIAWAKRFNLLCDGTPPPWLEFQAMKTLSIWEQYSCTVGKWDTLIPILGGGMRLPEHLQEIHIPVEADSDLKPSDTLKRARAQVDAHLRRVTRYFEKKGLSERSPINLRHISWAARFQVGGESIVDIAETTNSTHRADHLTNPSRIDERAVRAAVKKVVDFLEVDRRIDTSGPKRGACRRS